MTSNEEIFTKGEISPHFLRSHSPYFQESLYKDLHPGSLGITGS